MSGAPIVAASLALTRALEEAGYNYVIGGALALAYWSAPRATLDIDMTIDVDVMRLADLLVVLRKSGCQFEDTSVMRAAERGDFGVRIDGLRVDVFLPMTEHTEAALERRTRVPFGEGAVFVMTAEDVLLTKLIFGRTKDFADIERLLAQENDPWDDHYVESWLAELFASDDSRLLRYRQLQAALARSQKA